MNADELRAAATRYRTNSYTEDEAAVDQGYKDMRDLADAYLAEHPADDGEPVTEECGRCDGTGMAYIIGRDGRRVGSGVSTWNGPTRGGWPIEDCRDCGSSGRIPRLCPPTAQPAAGYSTGYFIDHNRNIVGLHRWPGVRFVMPT